MTKRKKERERKRERGGRRLGRGGRMRERESAKGRVPD